MQELLKTCEYIPSGVKDLWHFRKLLQVYSSLSSLGLGKIQQMSKDNDSVKVLNLLSQNVVIYYPHLIHLIFSPTLSDIYICCLHVLSRQTARRNMQFNCKAKTSWYSKKGHQYTYTNPWLCVRVC